MGGWPKPSTGGHAYPQEMFSTNPILKKKAHRQYPSYKIRNEKEDITIETEEI